MHSPIVVSGLHRTGTTWVGKIISESDKIVYIHEPFNIYYKPGVFDFKIKFWYKFVDENDNGPIYEAMKHTLNFNYNYWARLKSTRSLSDLKEAYLNWKKFRKANKLNLLPLIKDPISYFSLPWFYEQFNAQIIVLIRHPAAFIYSIKRLNWNFDFNNIYNQTKLMKKYFSSYKDQIKEYSENRKSVVDNGILLWKLFFHVLREYKEKYDWYFIKHENVSQNPVNEFQKIFSHLSLDFSDKIIKKIKMTSSSNLPKTRRKGNHHNIHLDSSSVIKKWKNKLSNDEIKRIKFELYELIHDTYPDAYW